MHVYQYTHHNIYTVSTDLLTASRSANSWDSFNCSSAEFNISAIVLTPPVLTLAAGLDTYLLLGLDLTSSSFSSNLLWAVPLLVTTVGKWLSKVDCSDWLLVERDDIFGEWLWLELSPLFRGIFMTSRLWTDSLAQRLLALRISCTYKSQCQLVSGLVCKPYFHNYKHCVQVNECLIRWAYIIK